jgi:hypothetical protein
MFRLINVQELMEMGVFLFLKASEQPVETTRMVRGS